jgi:Glycine-zipper domain
MAQGRSRWFADTAFSLGIVEGTTLKATLSMLVVAGCAALTGCVIVPTGPTVMALPGSTKTYEQFQLDSSACQYFAQQSIGGPTQGASNQAAANAVAGTLIGAAAGAAIGAVTGQAGPGAAIGAGTGLLFGSAASANVAGYSSYQIQQLYDQGYLQCMYAKGNQVPVPVGYRRPRPYPPPAGYYGPPPVYSAPPPTS